MRLHRNLLWIVLALISLMSGMQVLAAQEDGSSFGTAGEVRTQSGSSAGEIGDEPRLETVNIDVSPNPVGRGDRFSITMVVPSEETGDIEVESPVLPEQFSRIGGPYIRPVYEINEGGRRVKKSRISFVYTSGESGRFEIGRYLVDSNGERFETNPALVEIGLYRNRELIVPPDISWNIRKERAYVGENVVWILEAEGLKDIRIFEQVDIDSPEEGFFEPVDGIGAIVRYSLGGTNLYREPVVEYLFTPSAPGTIRVPRGLVAYEGLRLQSDGPLLEVAPLPGEVEENGIVGDFELTASIDRENIRVGENIHVRMIIRGTGNLNYLRLPPPETEGWTVVSEEEIESYEAGPDGYEGYRERVYTLSPDAEGRRSIRIPEFSAINPANDSIYSLGGERFDVLVEGAAAGSPAGKEEESFPFEPRLIKSSSESEPAMLYFRPLEYLWMLPGPLVFVVFFLLRRRKSAAVSASLLALSFLLISSAAPPVEVSELARNALQAYEDGDWETSYASFRTILEKERYCPDAAYNLALSAYRMDRVGEAVYFIRSAIYSLPSQQEYRDFLAFIEETDELAQHDLFPWPVHPDMILLFLVISINFSGFIGVFYLFTRKNGYFIAAMLLFVVSIALGSALAYSVHSGTREVAVALTDDVAVKTIPRTSSSEAFVLKEGESAQIIGRAEPFLFVRTVLGRRGWVRGEQLGLVGLPYDNVFQLIDTSRRTDGFR